MKTVGGQFSFMYNGFELALSSGARMCELFYTQPMNPVRNRGHEIKQPQEVDFIKPNWIGVQSAQSRSVSYF